jgi:hypothetical protein
MKRYRSILMAGALLFALSLAAVAQYENQEPAATPSLKMTSTVTGTVTSVSLTSLVIQLAGGDQMIFIRDANTSFPVTLGAGDAVRVGYETPEAGTFRASMVTLDTADTRGAPRPQDLPSNSSIHHPEPVAGKTDAASKTLPGTASPLSTIGLLGILALGGGLTLRALRA